MFQVVATELTSFAAGITSLSLCYPEGGSLYTSPGQPATYTFTLSSLSLTHRPDFSLEALQSLLQPSLNSLRLDIVHYSARTEDFHLLSLQDALLPALTPLLPHLSSPTLALDSRLSERIRAPLWPALASCTSFKNYGLTILQAEAVNPVPVPLHTFAALKFSVASGTASGRELLALLRGGSTALEKLKKLRIEVEEQDFRSLAESEAILSHCQQRGIEVDLFRDWD